MWSFSKVNVMPLGRDKRDELKEGDPSRICESITMRLSEWLLVSVSLMSSLISENSGIPTPSFRNAYFSENIQGLQWQAHTRWLLSRLDQHRCHITLVIWFGWSLPGRVQDPHDDGFAPSNLSVTPTHPGDQYQSNPSQTQLGSWHIWMKGIFFAHPVKDT